MLNHLYLQPMDGVCNRLRAIACARRIIENLKWAKLDVLWEWGNPYDFFRSETDFMWRTSFNDIPPHVTYQTLGASEGGNVHNRTLPVNGPHIIQFKTCHLFNADNEMPIMNEGQVSKWLPRPSVKVDELTLHLRRDLGFEDNTVGVHIRRGDNKWARASSPDQLFINQISGLYNLGNSVFLATDSRKTEKLFKAIFPKLLTFPKNRDECWYMGAREYRNNPVDRFEDWLDFNLLASCQYVIGGTMSSYSRLAVIYNGSPACVLLGQRLDYSVEPTMNEYRL